MQTSERAIHARALNETKIPIEEISKLNFTHILLHKSEHNDKCIYCGCQMSAGERTRDHLVPRARIRGVSNPFFRSYFGTLNIVQCCVSCNTLKGSASLQDFLKKVRLMESPKRMIIMGNIHKLLSTEKAH